MKLTFGAVMFHWKPDILKAFYDEMAKADVDRVVVGELVCSKRLPFYEAMIPEFVAALQEAGKDVVLSALALPTLKRERKTLAGLGEMGLKVEVNDLTMLQYLDPGQPFTVGPLLNVYNRGTVDYLIGRGATSICLPPELPLESVSVLAPHITGQGAEAEVWAYGRLPLAMSGRCYHARLADRAKDNCQFVCEDDPDGLPVDTLDGQKFLAVNGVQTLSDSYACMAGDIDVLREAGVTALRLSPHTGAMGAVASVFRAVSQGSVSGEEALQKLHALAPERAFSNGFLFGKTGAEWSHDKEMA